MKTINLFLFVLLTFSTWCQTYTTGTVNLSNTAGLAMTVKLDLSTNVTITLTGPSSRWFAVGFNASSMAVGTDVVGVHSAGTLTNFDANLTGYSAPATDAQQHWTITSDQVVSGVRTIVATRALNTGDVNDYVFTAGPGTLSLIWARGNANSFNYAYHGNTNRGISTATLTLVPVTPPPTGSASQTFCAGATVSQLVAVGSNIQWYANASGGSPLAGTTPLVNGTTYHASQTVGGLESQNRLPVTVSIIATPAQAPVFIAPPASVCSNANSITFNVNNVNGATSYLWFNQAGQGITTQPTFTYPLSPGMTSVNISVNAANQCGQGPTATHTVLINTAYNYSLQQTACDTFVWNNQAYTSSGSYTYQGTTAAGCDSIVTLELVVLNGSSTNVQVAQCTALTMNGITYNQSGVYQQILPSALGCDSVVSIDFTLYPSYDLTFDTTVTGSFVWNNQTYAETGAYTQNLTTSNGCDSSVTVNLTVLTGGISTQALDFPFPTVLRGGDILHLPFGSWELYTHDGRLIRILSDEQYAVMINEPPGLYFVRNGKHTVRIFILE